MYVITALISIILIIIISLILIPLNATLIYNSEKLTDFNLVLRWLKPLIKGIITKYEDKIIFSVYLFGKRVFTKNITANKSNDSNNYRLIKCIKFINITMQTLYGFKDPSITGMVCGAVNVISEYIDIDSAHNNPDFSTDIDYLNIKIVVKVNVVVSVLNLLKQKKQSLVMQELHMSK